MLLSHYGHYILPSLLMFQFVGGKYSVYGFGCIVVFTPMYRRLDMCCPGWSEYYDKTISSYVRRIW